MAPIADRHEEGANKDNVTSNSSIIPGMEDSADNFARGYYSEGRRHINRVEDQLRKMIEACDSIQVFFIFEFS